MSLKLMVEVVAFFLGHPVYAPYFSERVNQGNSYL